MITGVARGPRLPQFFPLSQAAREHGGFDLLGLAAFGAANGAAYWADYGRALARIGGRQDDAVRALRRAERISPARVQHHPFTRDVVAELLARSRRDAVGRELRGMAYRAGLPV